MINFLRLSAMPWVWLLSIPLLTLAVSSLTAAEPLRIIGSGASFPAPLYLRWFKDYEDSHPKTQVDYQATSSGSGISNLNQGLISFAGADLPLSLFPEETGKAGLLQFPMTAGAVVLGFNLSGIEKLQLSREALAGIFLGTVTQWDHELIRADNEGVELPAMPIAVITRADPSGTSFAMTRYLSDISPQFKTEVGNVMKPVWPKSLQKRGGLIRAQGNGGLAATIMAIPGSIGYVQYSYTFRSGIPIAALENKLDQFTYPAPDAFNAAVASVRPELDEDAIADPKNAAAYPILALTWIITRKKYDDPAVAEAIRKVLQYCLTEGQKANEELGYIKLSDKAAKVVLERVKEIQ